MLPKLVIDLDKIRSNTKALVKSAANISVFGVTKACLGSPEIAQAMVAGGVSGLADSRLENLKKLKYHFDLPLLLLRQPMIFEIDNALEVADYIVVSEYKVAEFLAKAARKKESTVEMLLMIEMGDGRDGLGKNEVVDFIKRAKQLDGATVGGLIANVGCSFGAIPTVKQLEDLARLSRQATEIIGSKMAIVSGGNSSVLPLLLADKLPAEINNLRFGESILLGHETVNYQPVDGLSSNAFTLMAEVIEVKKKDLGRGMETRAIIALGRQDIAAASLMPLRKGSNMSARSSDHLVLRLKPGVKINIGDQVEFIPSYFALLAAMTSPYVKKEFKSLSLR